jgi:hypothetical protein
MTRIFTYERLVKALPFLTERYEDLGREVPSVSVIQFDEWPSDATTRDEYSEVTYRNLLSMGERLRLLREPVYFGTMISKGDMTDKIASYLKVWKRMREYDLSGFSLGDEYEFIMNSEGCSGIRFFGACARIEGGALQDALKILFDYQNRRDSFLITSPDIDYREYSNAKSLFDVLSQKHVGRSLFPSYDLYDFTGLFESPSAWGSFVTVSSDGEGMLTSIYQRD